MVRQLIGSITAKWRNHMFWKHENNETSFMTEKEFRGYMNDYDVEPDPPAFTVKDGMSEEFITDDAHYSKNIILSQNFRRPINSKKLIGNNNVLIVGGPGTGKTSTVIKPNILQMNSSYVIDAGTGAEYLGSLGKTLYEHGYKIKVLNFMDPDNSCCYNPFNYLKNEDDVLRLVQCFIDNTIKSKGGGDNQFFVDAEKLLYSACIFYLRDFCQNDMYKNFAGVMSMINSSSVNENDPSAKSPLDELFDKLPKSSLAWRYYKAFKQASGKTLKSIIISCLTRLQLMLTPGLQKIMSTDEIDMVDIGQRKTALFIVRNDDDDVSGVVSSILYKQLLSVLYESGEKAHSLGKSIQLPVHVCLITDNTLPGIYEYPSWLSTMRKYNISAMITVQNISQLEKKYGENWKTLVGNCSTIVFLGTRSSGTAKYFSGLLKRRKSIKTQSKNQDFMTSEEIMAMDPSECIVFSQNTNPFKDKKYIYEDHPFYPETADCDPNNAFYFIRSNLSNDNKYAFKSLELNLLPKSIHYFTDKENFVISMIKNGDLSAEKGAFYLKINLSEMKHLLEIN